MTLTKADIIENLYKDVDIMKKDAKALTELVMDEITTALCSGHSVKLSGFGNLALNDKKERPGRNPKTGEIIPVSARRVVTFHSGQKLRLQVEQYAVKANQHDSESLTD